MPISFFARFRFVPWTSTCRGNPIVILSRNFLKQGPKLRAEDPLILPFLQAENETAAYSLQ